MGTSSGKVKRRFFLVSEGEHAEAIEEKNKSAAITQLAAFGFSKKLISAAFEGDLASIETLSSKLRSRARSRTMRPRPTLLKFSASAMMAACYEQKDPMPESLVLFILFVLGAKDFNRKVTGSYGARKDLIRFIVAFPNASLTTVGKYLGGLSHAPKVHVETIKSWCCKEGISEILRSIREDYDPASAREIRAQCGDDLDISDRFLKRDTKLPSRGVLKFLRGAGELPNSKKRS